MSLIFRNCPVCNNPDNQLIYHSKDYSVSGEIFNIVKCTSCGMVYTNPIPDEKEIGDYYKTEDYISHTDTNEGLINKLYHLVRNYTLGEKYKLIKKLNNEKKGSLLDIGCGTGYFLAKCKINGWEVLGTEPDEHANKLASKNVGKAIPRSVAELPPTNKFNIITLWHVLEHIHDLKGTLHHINSLLSETGHLIIAVPNHEALDAKIYKENWAALDVPRHLYHFSKSTVQQLLANYQFKLIDTLPMKFDSFYVSLITEKNLGRKGIGALARAFLTGLKSNIASNDNYSSQIYIFQRSK